MKYELIRWLGLCLTVLVCASCGKSNPSNRDPFYTSKGGWDYARMPLIKPYEVWLLNNEYSIFASGKSRVLVIDPLSICVASHAVYGKAGSQDIEVNGRIYPANKAGPFFALRTDSNWPEWFATEEALRNSIADPQVRGQPFEEVHKLFDQFQRTGKCAWFPSSERDNANKQK